MTLLAEPDQRALEAQVREANLLLTGGDEEGALALLAPLTSDENSFLPARFLLAMTAWKMGRLDWAVELMRDCHDRWPMDGAIAEVLASLYAQAGNFNESLFMAKLATGLGIPGELLGLVPKGFPIFDSVFYNFREKPMLAQAKANLSTGNLGMAIEYARQHSALNPQDGDAYVFLATLMLRGGMASVVVEILRMIMEKIVGNGELPAHGASLFARALTAVGEFDEARAFHTKAQELAPDSAEIAAARIADSVWLDEKPQERRSLAEDWVRRFCAAPKPRQWQRPDGKLVIGYIVSAFADPLDIAAVAAVARAHDRERVTVVGYGTGAQSWSENALLSGAFDKWQDISGLDPATLARFFLRGGLHVLVDAAGFAAPNCTMALAQLQTAIRVSWLGNPGRLGAPLYDAQIAGLSPEAIGATPWQVGSGYPVLKPLEPMPSRAVGAGAKFGADVWMPQLDKATIELWSSLLEAHPNAQLLLRAHDMTSGGNVDRLVSLFGRELAAKIEVVGTDRAVEFYAAVDVALLPCRGHSPRAAAEALACGVPTVALAWPDSDGPYGSFLREMGLGARLVASDKRDYVSIATGLATSAALRAQAVGDVEAAVGQDGARAIAKALEDRAIEELELIEELSP